MDFDIARLLLHVLDQSQARDAGLVFAEDFDDFVIPEDVNFFAPQRPFLHDLGRPKLVATHD